MQRYRSQITSDRDTATFRQSSPAQQSQINNFLALRKLKQADNQLDLMKRRLSALRIKEEKNNRKSQTAIKKVKYHQMIQEMEQRERERKEMYRLEVSNRVQQQRSLNSSERSMRKKKIMEVKDQYHQMKSSHYKAEKETSKLIEQRIQQLEDKQIRSRRETYDKIKDYQEKSRRNYQIYLMQRQSAIRFHKENENSRIIDMQEKKELEMRNLARMEIQMLERQSKSRQVAQDSTRQLQRIINPRKSLEMNKQALKKALSKTARNPEQSSI